MTNFRSILEVDADYWIEAMGLAEDEIPEAVIVEGSWWRAERQAWRLGYLDDVRELGLPDLFWGRRNGRPVAFCMAYGAPRTVEVIHIFSMLGAKLAVQIGTCGGLQSHLRPGDIVVPESAVPADGVAVHFGTGDVRLATPSIAESARAKLEARSSRSVHVGRHVTFSSLFAESVQMMEAWHVDGLLSVEMETATTFAVAAEHGTDAVAMLVVWDELTRGRRFSDPMSDEDLAALDAGNKDIYEVALELVDDLA
jgi:purine-nucleoside phosphorylase